MQNGYNPKHSNSPRGTLALPVDCANLDDYEFQPAPSAVDGLRLSLARQAETIARDLRAHAQEQGKIIAADNSRARIQETETRVAAFRISEQRDAERIAGQFIRALTVALE